MCNCNEILRNYFYKLKIKYQVFIGVITIILINLLLITFTITLNVFLLSNSAYKDIVNNLDNMEFDELVYYSIAAENGNMHLNEFMRTYIAVVGDFKRLLGARKNTFGVINSNLIDASLPNFMVHYDDYNPSTSDISKTMVYFSPSMTKAQLTSDSGVQQEIKLVKSVSPILVSSQNIKIFNYMYEEQETNPNYFNKIVIVNYKRNTIFVYPGNATEINQNIDLNDVKTYIQTKYILMRQMVEGTVKIRPNSNFNFTTVKSALFLPLFAESDIFQDFFISGKYDFKIMTCFNVYDNVDSVTLENYLDKIDETVFIFSKESPSFAVYDALLAGVSGTYILAADYLYPYKLITDYQCQKLLYQRNYNMIEASIPINDLSNCFNNTRPNGDVDLNDITTYMSEKEQIFYLNNLFNNLISFPVSNSTKFIINQKEEDTFNTPLLSYNIANETLVSIDSLSFKLLKSYSPFSSYNMFQYYYPITNIKLTFVLRDEQLFSNDKRYVFMKSIGNFIISFAGSLIICYVILGFIICHLIKSMNLIDKPLNLINDAVQSISEKDKFVEAKSSLEKYIYDTNNDEVIDEFVELITIILDMIEGNMNLRQEMTQTGLCKLKMEEEKINREFEMIKLNNLYLLEDIILEQAEKKNIFNDILKINLDKEIFEDEKVRVCSIFMGIFERHRKNTKRSRANKYDLSKSLKLNENGIYLKFPKFPFKQRIGNKEERKLRSLNKRMLNNKPDDEEILKTDEDCFSTSTDNEDEEINVFNFEEKQKSKIKKMFRIKDEYIIGKLRRPENILFKAYSNLKHHVRNAFVTNFNNE